MKRNVKVALVWHNLNSANFGVGALAISHISMLFQAATFANVNLEIETIGSKEVAQLGVREELEMRVGQPIPHTNFSLRQFVRDAMKFRVPLLTKLRKFDLVLDIGEGDSFSDIYGKKRYAAHLLTKWISLVAGTRLMLCPQTIGPFSSPIVSFTAAFVMRRAVGVWARDDQSVGIATALGVYANGTTDVAFSLPYMERPVDPDAVGLNVSGLLLSGGYDGANQFGLKLDYLEFCRKLVAAFRERGKTVHLIAHVIIESDVIEDDYRACLALKDHFKDDDSVVIAPRFRSATEAKSYISGMSFFVGSRMHATIASFSSGVPTIPVAYSRKFEGVFGALAYPYTVDARSERTLAALNRVIGFFDENREQLSRDLIKSRSLAEDRNSAYVQALASELANV